MESGVSETSESPEPGERGRDQGHRIHGMDASVGGKSELNNVNEIRVLLARLRFDAITIMYA